MLLRISAIIGSVISMFILLVGFFSFVMKKGPIESSTLIGILLILVMQVFFLLFNFICYKYRNYNKQNIEISKNWKSKGTTTLVLNIIASIVTLVCAVVMSSVTSPANHNYTLIIFLITLFLSGLVSIINMFFCKKLLKENKNIVNNLIAEIGI